MKLFNAAAIVALVAATVMLPTAASAQPETSRTVAAAATGDNHAPFVATSASGTAFCPLNSLCLYVDVDYQGQVVYYWPAGAYTSDFRTIACSICGQGDPDFDDDASSWFNNTNMTYCVSWYINGGNPDNTMPPGSRGNFTTTGWNDKASSLSFIGCP